MKSLVPCPSCGRHVRASEHACPFCAAALPDTIGALAVPGTTQRLSRAAAFAFTATLAVAGCGDTVTPPPGDAAVDMAPVDNGGPAPLYGAPVDSGVRPDTGVPVDTGVPADDGAVVAMYGTPPPVDSGVVVDDGSIGALYGAVPSDVPVDTGGGGVRYGAPPTFDFV